jgi:hypothetical protein
MRGYTTSEDIMSKSDTLEADLLNFLYRTSTSFAGATGATKPANRWLALHSADPTDAAAANELSGGGYARVAIPVADASWSAPAANGATTRISNAGTISFAETTGSAGTATYFSLRDAATAGNILHHGALGASRALTAAGIILTFAPGTITIDEG